jgi:hypothetical protein
MRQVCSSSCPSWWRHWIHNYSHGFQTKCVLWWPLGSLGVDTTIHLLNLSFFMDLLDLLLLYTKRSSWVVHDGQHGISRMISSTKSRVEAMHIDSSFIKPNVWNMDMENHRWHNLHLLVDGQSQWWSLIPVRQPCDNCLWQSQVVSLQPPLPLPMLRVWTIVLTSFMNRDHTSLMNFRQFVVIDEPNCLLCCVYGNDKNVCHPSQNCPLLLDGYQCFKCFGPHPSLDCHNSIPHSLDNCPKCHLWHNGEYWAMSHCMKEGMMLIA